MSPESKVSRWDVHPATCLGGGGQSKFEDPRGEGVASPTSWPSGPSPGRCRSCLTETPGSCKRSRFSQTISPCHSQKIHHSRVIFDFETGDIVFSQWRTRGEVGGPGPRWGPLACSGVWALGAPGPPRHRLAAGGWRPVLVTERLPASQSPIPAPHPAGTSRVVRPAGHGDPAGALSTPGGARDSC